MCVCRGRCTQVAIEKVLLYFCQITTTGQHPALRHDGLPFTEEARRSCRDAPFCPKLCPNGLRFALSEYRADWLQLTSGFGFPAANSDPFCWKCSTMKRHAYKFENSWCWDMRTQETFQTEASRVTLVVKVDAAALKSDARYSKRWYARQSP